VSGGEGVDFDFKAFLRAVHVRGISRLAIQKYVLIRMSVLVNATHLSCTRLVTLVAVG